MTIRLPWPPSANTYWRHRVVGKGVKAFVSTYVSPAAKDYREEVWAIVCETGNRRKYEDVRLAVSIELTAPTKRKYDIDNRIKVLLDALEYAGVYDDDEQIDKLVVTRLGVESPGCADVVIEVVE